MSRCSTQRGTLCRGRGLTVLSPATSECCPLNLAPTTSVIAGGRGRSLPARLAVGFNAITVCAADMLAQNKNSKDTVRRQWIEMSAKFTRLTRSDKFKCIFCTLGESQRATCPGRIFSYIPRVPVYHEYLKSKNLSFPTCTSQGTGCPRFLAWIFF